MARQDGLPEPATSVELYLAAILDELRLQGAPPVEVSHVNPAVTQPEDPGAVVHVQEPVPPLTKRRK